MTVQKGVGAEQPAALRPARPVRQKSGLVRTASAYQAFIFAQTGVSVGVMICWGQFFGTSSYPGSNTLLATALATLAGLLVVWAYQFWGQIFPRSGGDYVFLSRTFNPGLAFGINLTFLYCLSASPALAMSIVQPLVSSFAHTMFLVTGWSFLQHASTWLLGDWAFAVVGTVQLLIFAAVSWFGLKATLRLLMGCFVVGLGGAAILIVALLFSSASTFNQHLHAVTGLTPSQVIHTARKNGFVTHGFSLSESVKLTVWYTPSLLFAYIAVYIGGEIKNVRRSLRIAGVAAVMFSGLVAIAWVAVLNHVVPSHLQGALAFNSTAAPTASTPGVAFPYELMVLLFGHTGFGLVLTLITYICFLGWVLSWGPLTISIVQRAVLAWSLDGLMPRKVSYVDPKRHSPVVALIIAFLFAEYFVITFAFIHSYRNIVLLTPIFILLSLSLLAGVFFPFVRRDLFAQSVVGKSTILGVPLMSIACAIGFAVIVWQAVLIWQDPIAGGTNHGEPIYICVGIALLGTLYYQGLRQYRRRHGEDISSTFREIPVE